jgi:protocatechuate 3,4-dioxygenase alpha subunit
LKEFAMSGIVRGITPSQTIGPFSAYALTPQEPGKNYARSQLVGADLVTSDAAGERVRIEGRVLDGAEAPIEGVLLEIWQADAQGRYAHPRDTRALPNASFKGFGRVETDIAGRFKFDTIKPGAVPGPDGRMQAPHIVLALHVRGLLVHLYSRIYFSDEATNADDPILALVPADRRETLIAQRAPAADDKTVYRFDVRVRSDRETVFFDI